MGEEAYAAFELGCTMASQDLSRLTTISFLRHTSRERTATANCITSTFPFDSNFITQTRQPGPLTARDETANQQSSATVELMSTAQRQAKPKSPTADRPSENPRLGNPVSPFRKSSANWALPRSALTCHMKDDNADLIVAEALQTLSQLASATASLPPQPQMALERPRCVGKRSTDGWATSTPLSLFPCPGSLCLHHASPCVRGASITRNQPGTSHWGRWRRLLEDLAYP